jgi:hypothetical protein
MPGKAKRLPGRKGRYYKRKDGKFKYKGKHYSKITPSLDRKRRCKKSAVRNMGRKAAKHHNRNYPHAGDRRTKKSGKGKHRGYW